MRRTFCVVLLATFGLAGEAVAAGGVQGKIVCRGVRDCANAVVYIDHIPGRTFPPTAGAVMDQVKLAFVPHILPVTVGTTVAFPNSDEVRHNVFSPSPVKRFNLGSYSKGITKEVVFDKPGVVELLCNVHAEMSAYVIVTHTPYVAVAKPDGTYVLAGLPAGSYTVVAWRPQLKEQRQQVAVRDGEVTTINFELRR